MVAQTPARSVPPVSVSTEKERRRYVSLKEAAEYHGCTERSIRNRISDGTLPAYKLGKGPKARIRIRVDDLERLLEPIPAAGQRCA